MSIVVLIAVLTAVAVLLALAEVMLPTGGVLGIIAGLCAVAAIVLCFTIDKWLGMGVTVAAMILAPFLAAGVMKLWERSPVGKKLIITNVAGKPDVEHVVVGSIGTALSPLRPMGEADFAGDTLQVLSEFGPVGRGEAVRVLSFDGVVARVRALRDEATQANTPHES